MKIRKLKYISFSALCVVKILIFSIIVVLLSVNPSFAQKYGEIGIMAGGSYYIGDLNQDKHFLLTKPAIGGFIRHNFNERFAAKISGTFSSIEGDDSVSKINLYRGLDFKSSLIDISTTFEINFFNYFIGSKRQFITPFWYGGIGVVFFKPKRLNGGDPAGSYTEKVTYKTMALSFPFGIGLKYSLNDMLGMSVHWGMQKVFTDYLDDVSTTYEVIDNITDPAGTHELGMQRGNSQDKDWYSIIGISISKKINYLSKEKCINVYF